MALYHFTAKAISFGKGESAVHRAAYHARTQLEDERNAKLTNDYSRKGDLAWNGIFTPKDAPEWTKDRGQLWNRAEKTERQANGQPARTLEIALPHELTREQQTRLLTDFLREQCARKGMVADAALHSDYDADGKRRKGADPNEPRNDHAHILLTMRRLDGDGFKKTKTDAREWNSKEQLAAWREAWARMGAKALRKAGFEIEAERFAVGHLTLPEQRKAALDRGDTAWADRLDREPDVKQGPASAQMEKRGQESDRAEARRAVFNRNAERQAMQQEAKVIDLELERIERQEREERRAAKIEQARAAEAQTKQAKIDARRAAGQRGAAPLRPSGAAAWGKGVHAAGIKARRQAIEARHRAAQEGRDETWARFRQDRAEGRKALADSYQHAIDRVWNPEPAAKPTGPDLSPWAAVNDLLQQRETVYRNREQNFIGRTLNALYHVPKGQGMAGFLRLALDADERRKAFEREQRRTYAKNAPKGCPADQADAEHPSPKRWQSDQLKERRAAALAEYDQETKAQSELLKEQHRQERAAERQERETAPAVEAENLTKEAGEVFQGYRPTGGDREASHGLPDANSDPFKGGAGDPAPGKPDDPGTTRPDEGRAADGRPDTPHPDPRQAEIDALRAWREARDAEGREQGGRERER